MRLCSRGSMSSLQGNKRRRLRLADLHREVFRPLIWNPTGEVSLYKNAPTVALIFAMASPAFAAKGFGSCEDLTRSAQWSNEAVSYRDDGHKGGQKST